MTQIAINNFPSITNFSTYIRYVLAIPSLTDKEERELLLDYKNNDSITSAQKLVLSQLKTVVNIASGYKNYGLPQEDLVQEGNVGLMKAVKNYDISQNVRLYSYALVWIKSEIQNYIIKNLKIVKIATTKNLKKLFFNFRKTQKEMIDLGVSKQDMLPYIAQKLQVEEEDVKQINSYFGQQDTDINDMNEDAVSYELIDYATPESLVQESHDERVYSKFITSGLKSLNEKQLSVIQMRYLKEEKLTHKEIGKLLKISSERVRQIELEALAKLKQLSSSS